MISINSNSVYTYGYNAAAYRRQNIQNTFAENVNKQLTPLYKSGSYDAALYETNILRKYMDYFKRNITSKQILY